MKSVEMAKVVSSKNITANIYDLVLECPKISSQAVPGQFVEVYTGRRDLLLARPISIAKAQGPARSPTVLETPKPASAKADAH